MAGWILTIDKRYPQHLDYALRDGVWDTERRFQIQAGDDLFFWRSGPDGGLAAHCVATTDLAPIGDERQSWDDEGVRTYKYRVHLEMRSDVPTENHSWSRLQEIFGSGALPHNSVVKVHRPSGLEELRGMFARVDLAWSPQIDLALDYEEPHFREYADLLDIPANQDERRSSLRAVVVRRGQPQFRSRLIAAYGRCVVTGCSVPAVLEAAHISPYRGDATNHVRNGLLLRADIHTIFDLSLLTILPDLTIRLSPTLHETSYGVFESRRADIDDDSLKPDAEMLKRHNSTCPWLVGTSPTDVSVPRD